MSDPPRATGVPGEGGARAPAPAEAAERWRWALYVAVVVAGALVVAQAKYPPVLDLAQQLDQIRLAGEVLAGDRPDLEIRWTGPNKLGYVPLALASRLAPAAWAPRASVLLLLAIGFGAVHLLARRTRHGAATALLASTLVFGSSFYAGFFNFVVGLLGLVYWTWELGDDRRQRAPWRIFLSTVAGALLLYLAHGLWLAVLGPVVATYVLLRRFEPREFLARVAGVAVLAPLALSFRETLATSGWQASGSVIIGPLQRLTDLDVAASIPYGGIKGALEPGLFLVVVVWLVAALAGMLRERVGVRSPFLMLAAASFLLLAFLGPFRVDLTILFAWRWGAPGFLALMMSLPAPPLRPAAAVALATAVLALHLAVTGLAWRSFDRVEMEGFAACLASIPDRSTVLGLDGRPASAQFRLTPTLQMHAYAGYERRAKLAFSFTEYGSSLVVRRDVRAINLIGQVLLMNPAQLRPSHLDDYSHVLVHGPVELGRALEQRTGRLRRVTGGPQWHLLEVLGSAPEPSLPTPAAVSGIENGVKVRSTGEPGG